MKPINSLLLLVLLQSTVAVSGHEDRGGPGKGRKRGAGPGFMQFLKKHDRDGDGRLSLEEFSAGDRAGKLSDEARRKIFERLDKNGDGQIAPEELAGPPPRPRDPILRQADTNGDRRISLEEYLANPPFQNAPKKRLERIFKRLDQNDDGFLDEKDRKQQRRRGGPPGGPGFPRFNFNKLDANGDGMIDWKEFQEAPVPPKLPESERRKLFDRIDEDGDGNLSRSEMRRHLQKRPPHPPRGPRRPDRGPKK